MKNFDAKEWLAKTKDMPDVPPCPKCGRVIYCGVHKMCQDKECPKKSNNRK